jgi:hypothetical protein
MGTPHSTHRWGDWPAYGAYLLIALGVLLPLLKPGFILTLDMVFTPQLRMPEDITSSSYIFRAALHWLNVVLPADIIQKLLLGAILVLSSVGMHRLLRLYWKNQEPDQWGIHIASVFYAINPFTYSRLMAGQYSVLLGYALVPWFVRAVIRFAHEPRVRNGLAMGGLAAVIGTVSIHTLGGLLLLSILGGIVAVWQHRTQLREYLRGLAAAAGIFVALCGVWLVPLAIGQGKTADTISTFTSSDAAAFATVGDSLPARLYNVLRLQGFWPEGRGMYILPQDRAVLWGLMALTIITLVVIGGVALYRHRRMAALWLMGSGILAALIAAGVGSGLLSHLGYREPHKFTGIVVLVYALLLAWGIQAVLRRTRQRWGDTTYAMVAVGLLVLPLLLTRVMFWGANGQLQPRQYPSNWAAVNDRLNQDTGDFSAVFLPWHQYQSFHFAGRIIASPAPAYFDTPVIVSLDPELGGASGGIADSAYQSLAKAIDTVQNTKNSKEFSRQLAAADIKYVLLAKELDYARYSFLRQGPDLRIVADYPEITLLENTAWREH